MQRLAAAVARIAPLISLAFMSLAAVQVALQLGASRAGVNAALAGYSSVYVSAATVAWLVVAAGLLFETLAPRDRPRRRGWIMDVLSRLTNRSALESMMAGTGQPEVIDAEALSAQLKAKVIGQDAVCDDLAAQIRRRLALAQRGKPIGIFLLAGPPGTGKTYLGKRLAIELNRKLLLLDMSQFGSPHGATMLFGSPKGYHGSDTYGKLTSAMRETPDAVVVLDEIEKAHPEVHKRFLTAWNDGYVTEASDGRQISTTRAIFMLTSNAATDELIDLTQRYASEPEQMRRAALLALRQAGFAPEVLNRLDRIFVFVALQGLDVARVAALEIEAMIQNYGLEVAEGGIDPAVLFDMMQRQERLGTAASARDLARNIEETISDSLITAKQRNAKRVALVSEQGRVVAEIAD